MTPSPPSPRTIEFRDQLKGFTVVNLPLAQVGTLFAEHLKTYGPVTACKLQGIHEVIGFLSPLKSFTTRFAAIQLDGWTCLLSDMEGAHCYTQGYALSRKTGCRAFGVVMLPERRELQVFEHGKEVREVQSLLDSDRWYFRESGEIQAFEANEEYAKRRKRDRLSVAALEGYFKTYTGLSVPDWKSLVTNEAVGLERSNKDARVPLIKYPTDTTL
jgi:hypothetical protein